jgi:hypothetical protein
MKASEKKKENMRNRNTARKKRILEATNNGRCWWLYQMLTHNSYNMKRR